MDYLTYKSFSLDSRLQCDLELIMNDGFSPLKGFMNQHEYYSVLEHMSLSDGSFFPLPINLPIPDKEAESLKGQKYLTLKDEQGFSLAVLEITDLYKPDLQKECAYAYGTIDDNHPYVKIVMNRKNMSYVGGIIVNQIQLPRHYDYQELRLTPEETKSYFSKNNWSSTPIVGFQTRNPMHRSHFELTKYALEQAGENSKLLLQPVVGITQPCDVDYHVRVQCYKKLVQYYPPGQALLSLLPLCMRMAGPREALLHALVRQNYGCSHFVIGRDHAGPSYKTKEDKPFYAPLEAQILAKQLQPRLKIKLLFSDNIVYVKELQKYLPQNLVPPGSTVLNISGTQQREMLIKNQPIPDWFTFPEVYDILKKEYNNNKPGFCLYFVGLSGSGKSTLACAMIDKLHELVPERKITYLDADNVRLHLSKGLGFSKEDRSTNVRRIGFVASEIVKHGGIVIVANIAPYEDDRQFNKDLINQFGKYHEVFVNTTLDECEKRDCKGLYKLARAGKIKQFTGIDDPFEVPKNPEFEIDGTQTVESSIEIIIKKLVFDALV